MSAEPVREVRISPAALGGLHDAADRSFPAECCGLLLGTRQGFTAIVGSAWPAANESRAAERFYVGPRQVWRAMRDAEAIGQRLLGVYHSHPHSTALPSDLDRRDAWPEHLQMITACAEADGDADAVRTRCWQLVAGSFVEVVVQARVTEPVAG